MILKLEMSISIICFVKVKPNVYWFITSIDKSFLEILSCWFIALVITLFRIWKGGIILKTCLDEFNHTIILNLCKISTYSISLEKHFFVFGIVHSFFTLKISVVRNLLHLYIYSCVAPNERDCSTLFYYTFFQDLHMLCILGVCSVILNF